MKYVLGIYVPGLLLGGFCLYLAVLQGYWPAVLVAWTLLSGLGIATGFHRIYSHKTYKLKPWLDAIILACGTLAGQGSSLTWVAVHLGYHHRWADTDQDLHSPTKGLWTSLVGWYLHVNAYTISHRAAAPLFRKKPHVWVHTHYFKLLYGWTAFLFLLSVGTGLPFVETYLAALALSLTQDNMVNVLCHQPKLGYRNWRLRDNSTNFWPLGYFGWGQGWHENHHAFPAKFNFGHRWWELDPALIFVPLLKLGSFKDIRDSKHAPH
jgi:sn-1 stearoyl-lipid 9-desaturase